MIFGASVQFEWSQVALINKPGGRSPVRYIFELDTADTFVYPDIQIDTSSTSITLSLASGRFFWRVKAYDDAGNQGEFSTPFNFQLRNPGPMIEVSVNRLDFGPVDPGGFKEKGLAIMNKGELDLEIENAVILSAVFIMRTSGFPRTIAPGDSISVTVRFLPQAVSEYEEGLTITSNDPFVPELIVPLSGRGETHLYPNPLITARGHTHLHFGMLPIGGTLIIYNVAGERLFEERIDSSEYDWDACLKNGECLPTDFYYYVIKDNNNKIIKKGKFSIIR
jgi:hypothetical protein